MRGLLSRTGLSSPTSLISPSSQSSSFHTQQTTHCCLKSRATITRLINLHLGVFRHVNCCYITHLQLHFYFCEQYWYYNAITIIITTTFSICLTGLFSWDYSRLGWVTERRNCKDCRSKVFPEKMAFMLNNQRWKNATNSTNTSSTTSTITSAAITHDHQCCSVSFHALTASEGIAIFVISYWTVSTQSMFISLQSFMTTLIDLFRGWPLLVSPITRLLLLLLYKHKICFFTGYG